MSGDSLVLAKAKAFALRIINLQKYLLRHHGEYVMSRQVLKSGTSIGANISEAIYGCSKPDFRSKMFIALKEASETRYWLEILHEGEYIDDDAFQSINSDCTELIKMLTAIVKSL